MVNGVEDDEEDNEVVVRDESVTDFGNQLTML